MKKSKKVLEKSDKRENGWEKSQNENNNKILWGEKWKRMTFKLPTKNHYYEISNFGRLRSIEKETNKPRLLKTPPLKTVNLQMFCLKLEGEVSKGIYIHKAVAEYFVKKDDPKKNKVLHLDGVKTNNHWKNLKWCTLSELRTIQVKKGLYPNISERKASNIKMTEAKVKALKRMLKRGKTKRKVLARKFNISEMQLSRIIRGENWGHVTED